MRDNGTDRDVALDIVSELDDILTTVTSIEGTLYAPSITIQPTDQVAAIGTSAVFTVVAKNAKSYNWQLASGGGWRDVSYTGHNRDTMSVPATEERYTYRFSCEITGYDDTVIRSDTVKIVPPDPEPGT